MTDTTLIAVFTLTLIGYISFDLYMSWNYFQADKDLVKGTVPFLRWWFRSRVASLGIAVAFYLIALLLVLCPEVVQILRKVNFSRLILYLVGVLAVVGYLYLDLKNAWDYYSIRPLLAQEGSFFRWWIQQNYFIISVAGVLGIAALLMTFVPDLARLYRKSNFSMGHPELLLLALPFIGLLVYDLKSAWVFYRDSPGLEDENESFLWWWVRKKVVLVCAVAVLALGVLLLTFFPGVVAVLRAADLNPDHPERLLLLLPFVLFIAYDLKVARDYYQETSERAKDVTEQTTFVRWYARKNVFKIWVVGGIALGVMLVMIFPEVIVHIRKVRINLPHSKLLTSALGLTLAIGGFLAFDIWIA